MPRSTPPAAAGTKTSRILQALAEAEFQISTDDVLAALGEKGADARRKLLGLLSFLKRTGRISGSDALGWDIEPPAKPAKAAKPRKERAVAVVEPKPVATVTPPGSVAVTDDGSVLLLDGDRIAARLTAQQAANVAALVQRYSGAA